MAQVDINDEDEEPLRFGYLEDHEFSHPVDIFEYFDSRCFSCEF